MSMHKMVSTPYGACFIDLWRRDRDPIESLANAMMDADLSRGDDYANTLLREEQVAALESECLSRGIIPEDFDADPITIPGMTRVDFESLEGCGDGEDRCDEWSDPDEA